MAQQRCASMVSLPSSRLQLQLQLHLRRWSPLVAVLFLVPLLATYRQLHQFLAVEKCILHKTLGEHTTATANSLGDGLACRGKRNRPYAIDTAPFSMSPPSIAGLVTILAEASAGSDRGSDNLIPITRISKLEQEYRAYVSTTANNLYVYDYAEAGTGTARTSRSRVPNAGGAVDLETDSSGAVEDSPYGFRRNPNKWKSSASWFSSSSSSAPTAATPLAMYFWLVLNVGLYGWYFYRKIDPGTVSLNRNLLEGSSNGNGNDSGSGDLGRALSGNLAHFEIWHLGLNAMSLVGLGEALETQVPGVGGSPGLFLWTGSFLALVALGVVLLHGIDRRFGGRLWRRSSTGTSVRIQFPSMVGFSGVLFAWSVYRTLALSDFAQSCPIPFLSGLCFSTHTLKLPFSLPWIQNGLPLQLRFSWGPIVQLAIIQVLLNKRVSFVGHLSGTIVGFLWHWGALPPLEISQPCVLYPVLWMVCKSAVFQNPNRWGEATNTNTNTNTTITEEGFAFASGGSALGGGRVLGNSAGSRWTLSKASEEGDDDDHHETENNGGSTSRLIRFLRGVQTAAVLHVLGMVYVYQGGYGFVLANSMVLSELLLVLILSLFVRGVSSNDNRNGNVNGKGHGHPLTNVGSLGRAYVAFVVVAFVTDSMTLGGWWATLPLWEWSSSFRVLILAATRFALWVGSSAAVCHALESSGELQRGNGNSGGIWSHVLGWSIAEPCASLGKVVVEALWNSGPSSTSTASLTAASALASNPPKGTGAASGRSTSNVAGKSRLV